MQWHRRVYSSLEEEKKVSMPASKSQTVKATPGYSHWKKIDRKELLQIFAQFNPLSRTVKLLRGFDLVDGEKIVSSCVSRDPLLTNQHIELRLYTVKRNLYRHNMLATIDEHLYNKWEDMFKVYINKTPIDDMRNGFPLVLDDYLIQKPQFAIEINRDYP